MIVTESGATGGGGQVPCIDTDIRVEAPVGLRVYGRG